MPPPTDPSRRRFVQGLALGGVAAGLGLWLPGSVRAAQTPMPALPELRGTDFALAIGHVPVNYTGAKRLAVAINGSVPGPVLRWKQGSTVTLRVTNHLDVPTSIHWHGILLPFQMDGVPGISFDGIAPGKTFTYRFPVRQSGTYWYHGHSGFQEQVGLYAPLVIEPAAGERFPADRDYVVMLNDWSDQAPASIFAMLRKQPDFYNYAQPTFSQFVADVQGMGWDAALDKHGMWKRMRMSPTDLADVTGHAYTYLMNGHTPAGNWTGLFRRGEKIRLRFINGSAMSYFDVRIPGMKMTVVSADGQDVEPISVDEFRLAVAETCDVMVEPSDDRAWCIFAQSMDRSGYVSGTLAPRPGMRAQVPAMDPSPRLDMVDMMGAMQEHHGMAGMSGMSSHAGHGMGMGMAQVPGAKAHHAASEFHNPGVAMHVDYPRTNLDDPGAGLRHNQRRVLNYADLHTIGGSVDTREPSRDIELHLTGNMHRYLWSFDGIAYADAKPVHFRAGERLRVVLCNDTMMNHPIHLHGMWSELEAADGSFQVRKHTVNVQPAQRITYGVTADALGRWAWHCHLLYHMEAGMFREVVVS